MNKLRLRKNPKGEMKKPRVWQKKLQNGCTLRKEREESNRLKRKYEDMQREMKSSKDELQDLQVERQVRETTQECLEKVQKEYQELKAEKDQLLGKVEELEEQQKIILQASELHTQEQNKKHQEQIASLTAALEEAREQ